MNRIQRPYARQLRQLKTLTRKVSRAGGIGAGTHASPQLEGWYVRLCKKLSQLMGRIPLAHLRKAVAGLGISWVMGTSVWSQTVPVFSGPTTNPFGLSNLGADLNFIDLVDIDADGDLDVFSGVGNGVIAFFENGGTASQPSFAGPTYFPFSLDTGQTYYTFLTFGDMDADGDQDLFTGEEFGWLNYYENVGDSANAVFAAPLTNPFGLVPVQSIATPDLADWDADGDLDLLVGEYYGNFVYYENTGGPNSPAFAAGVANPFGLTQGNVFVFPTAGDLDGDGDLDLVVGVYPGNFRYFENTGTAASPAFAAFQANPFGLQSGYQIADPELADLDGDGDLDLMVGEYTSTFQYYVNNPVVGMVNPVQVPLPLVISPNPASDRVGLSVEAGDLFGSARLTVLSGMGRMVLQQDAMVTGGRVEAEVDLGSLAPGTYTVRLKVGEQVYRKRFVKQ